MTNNSTVSRSVKPLVIERLISLTSEERAYIAGFFDGEGSIGVYNKRPGCYSYRLVIAQRRPEVLVWLWECLGGALRCVVRHDRNDTAYHELAIDHRQHIAAILRILLPYLRVKKLEADLMLRFMNGERSIDIVTKMSEEKRRVVRLHTEGAA